MTVHNADIAAQFNRMADLLEIEGANPFRVRAYRRAAATIEDLPTSVVGMLEAGEDLDDLPGIGADLAGKIREICADRETSDTKRMRTGRSGRPRVLPERKSTIRAGCFSLSLDGFGRPQPEPRNPLGEAGKALHDWFVPTRTFQQVNVRRPLQGYPLNLHQGRRDVHEADPDDQPCDDLR